MMHVLPWQSGSNGGEGMTSQKWRSEMGFGLECEGAAGSESTLGALASKYWLELSGKVC